MRRHWSAALTILAIVVFGSYLLYTEMLVREIRAEARVQTRIYAAVQQGLLAPAGGDAELLALTQIQGALRDLKAPMIGINPAGQPYAAENLPFEPDLRTAAGQKQVLLYAAHLAQRPEHDPTILERHLDLRLLGQPGNRGPARAAACARAGPGLACRMERFVLRILPCLRLS